MKLSTNLKLEIKLHLVFLLTLLPGTVVYALAFSMPVFDAWPLWAKSALWALSMALYYILWRQCLSPDKKTFTPRIWK